MCTLAAVDPSFDSDFQQSQNIFTTNDVAVVRVTMSPTDCTVMHTTERYSDDYFTCSIVFSNNYISETVTNVGIRLRGNTSRDATKKSYKLSFNEFAPGREFHGLEKFNLNGEHNDPSIIRAALCWSVFKDMKLPCSRTGYAELYINDVLYGLFINVEHYDDEFLDARFGNDTGNLFKCLYLGDPADLTYRVDGRYDLVGSGETYQLRTNEESNDFSDLAYFIDLLNNTSDALFPSHIEDAFCVERFIRWMAVDALVGSWDDYRYLANNYYLYHDPTSDKFEFIPYDYDNTLGIDFISRDWGTRDLNDWDRHSNPRPLSTRILAVPRYRRLYNQYLADISATYFAPSEMTQRATAFISLIQSAAEAEYASVSHDWGFSINDFNTALDTPSSYNGSPPVTYGILSYVNTRVSHVNEQLDPVIIGLNEIVLTNIADVTDEAGRHVAWLELYNPSMSAVSLSGLYLSCNSSTLDEWALPDITISARGFILLWLDGHPERGECHASFTLASEDTLYLSYNNEIIDEITAPDLVPGQSYGRYIDWGSYERIFAVPTPSNINEIINPPMPYILINEFQADNATTITNPINSSYSDWIELVNVTNTYAQLQGLYISDDINVPLKFQVTDPVTIEPNGHALVWTDGHPEYGGLHAGFKLSKTGENIILTASDGTTLIDRISFGIQQADITYGRYPNASGGMTNPTVFHFMEPTPGGINVPEPVVALWLVLFIPALVRFRFIEAA